MTDKLIEAVALAVRKAVYPNRPMTQNESEVVAQAALRAVRHREQDLLRQNNNLRRQLKAAKKHLNHLLVKKRDNLV